MMFLGDHTPFELTSPLSKGSCTDVRRTGLYRLTEMLSDLFSEDLCLAHPSLKPMFTEGRRPSVRRALLLCHMVSRSADRLWACRHFAIQTWQAGEFNRREFHISFESIRLAVRVADTDHVDLR